MKDVVTSAPRRADHEANGWWDATTLSGRVATHAAERAGDVAVVDASGRRTYADLQRDSSRVAGWLQEAGVATGDVVSLQLPNEYAAVVTAVAVQSIGAVINPLLPNYRRRELAHVFTTARPKAIFTPARYRDFDHVQLIDDVMAETGVRPVHVVVGGDRRTTFDDVLTASVAPSPVDVRASAVSEVIFTSGTEASPKAVMHTEQTTNFSVRVAHEDMGIGPDDVVWMPSPVGHSTGFNYGLRFALYHGLPLVLQDRWDAADAVDLVQREGCSYTLAATTFLQDLVDEASRRDIELSSLRCFGCGGAPVPAELVTAADERGIRVLRLYGSTEVLVATWNRPTSSLDHRRDTDGVAMSDVEVVVRAPDGRACAPGAVGEIFVRGPNTCVGFFDDPERTAATFETDGWVRSGDLAVAHGDGYLTVAGRKKEIIIRGGVNIAPREIEDLLVQFPEVARAAVVGLPDRRMGERSCACVVLREGASLSFESMVARLRDAGLATFKLPERLEILGALPTTASGKVQKHEIVRVLSEAAPA